MSNTALNKHDDRGNLSELIAMLKEFNTAMLVSISTDGSIRSRPMAIQDPDGLNDCDLWFVTEHNSPKVVEINQDHRVCIACFRQRDGAYLSISAAARIENNRDEIARLWKPDWKLWFPEGKDDPSIALMKCNVQRAEYWEPKGGKLRVLFDMLRAAIQDKPADAYQTPPKHI